MAQPLPPTPSLCYSHCRNGGRGHTGLLTGLLISTGDRGEQITEFEAFWNLTVDTTWTQPIDLRLQA